MKRYLVTYICTALIFAAVDSVWIGLVAANLYRRTLGPLVLDQFRAAPAIAFYLLLIAGIMVFVIPKTGSPQSVAQTALFGALFGFFTYATFDLTSYAVLRPWTWYLTWTDLAWGTVLTAAASGLGQWAATAILARF
jgi:uncharacterized membrane protein